MDADLALKCQELSATLLAELGSMELVLSAGKTALQELTNVVLCAPPRVNAQERCLALLEMLLNWSVQLQLKDLLEESALLDWLRMLPQQQWTWLRLNATLMWPTYRLPLTRTTTDRALSQTTTIPMSHLGLTTMILKALTTQMCKLLMDQLVPATHMGQLAPATRTVLTPLTRLAMTVVTMVTMATQGTHITIITIDLLRCFQLYLNKESKEIHI